MYRSTSILICMGLVIVASSGHAQNALQKERQVFVWELDSLDAFVKAVESTKPMVVVFGHQPLFRSKEGTNYTNRQRAEFDKPELIALQNEAVFVIGYPDADEYTRRMASHLKLTVFPTISVIEPRTDQLTEVFRLEGYFEAKTVAKDLKAVFASMKPKPDETKNPKVAKPAEKQSPPAELVPSKLIPLDKVYEKKPVTPTNLEAIKKAVSEYEAGYKAGDVEQIIKLSAEPFCLVLRESFDHIKLVGKAKRNLLAAMDEKFGKQSGTIPYGIDDDKIRQRMKRVVSFYLMEHETSLGLNVTLSIAAKLTNGKEETWKLVAVRQADGGWKLWPHKADGMSDIGTTETWRVNMTKLARSYDEVTILVQAGRIASREDAQQAAFAAYSRVMSPGFGKPPKTSDGKKVIGIQPPK